MKKSILIPLLLCFQSITFFSFAGQEDSAAASAPDSASLQAAYQQLDSILHALDYQSGSVIISDDLATVTVPEGYGFLNAKDARYILEDVWNNPKDETILGMLVRRDVDFLEGNAWAVIYSYEEEGHVKDDDAEDIKYDELLEEMQKDAVAGNPERIKAGYPEMELIGWAKSPYYDQASHKLHWAKEIKFGKEEVHTLNYNIRMLGRKGVLVMNVIAGMDNIKTVDSNINAILASTNFNPGKRYEDFDSSVDKVAAYGLAGLITGGVLLKTGLLAKLGLILLKAWKLIALAVVGALAFLRKKFTGRKKAEEVVEEPKQLDT